MQPLYPWLNHLDMVCAPSQFWLDLTAIHNRLVHASQWEAQIRTLCGRR